MRCADSGAIARRVSRSDFTMPNLHISYEPAMTRRFAAEGAFDGDPIIVVDVGARSGIEGIGVRLVVGCGSWHSNPTLPRAIDSMR